VRETTLRKPPAGLGNRCFIAPNNKHRDPEEGARHCAGRHRGGVHHVNYLIRLVESCACGKHYGPRLFTAPGPLRLPPFVLLYLTSATTRPGT
jgi:hypothetical protein